MAFKEINPYEIEMKPIAAIGKEAMLVTAGTKERFNTMTASWGQVGELWSKPVSVIYIRPQRYTKTFVDKEALYTLSFFDDNYHKELMYLGTHSGRDEDKVAKVGLAPLFDEGCVYFEEANLVLICKKLYRAPLKAENFIDKAPLENYTDGDFHDVYVGEILKALVKE